MKCSLLKKRAGRADGAGGVGLKKMELGGLARTACHEVPLRPHYVMRMAKLERRKFVDWARCGENQCGGRRWHFGTVSAERGEVQVSVDCVGGANPTLADAVVRYFVPRSQRWQCEGRRQCLDWGLRNP